MKDTAEVKNNKNKIFGIILLIFIILIIIIIILFNNIVWQKDDNGKIKFKESINSYFKGEIVYRPSEVSHVMLIEENQDFPDAKIIQIYTFDENDICIGWKAYHKDFPEEELKERYRAYRYGIIEFENVSMQSDGITYDMRMENGKATKQEILDSLKDVNYIEF